MKSIRALIQETKEQIVKDQEEIIYYQEVIDKLKLEISVIDLAKAEEKLLKKGIKLYIDRISKERTEIQQKKWMLGVLRKVFY